MNYTITALKPHHCQEAISLVKKVFDQFEAPEYSPQGIDEFYNYLNQMDQRFTEQYSCFIAVKDKQIIGQIETRNSNHISLLFVNPDFHRQGIARTLFQRILEESPDVMEYTVNSSPFAVSIYQKLGFICTSEEQTMNGIRFIPMTRKSS